MLTVYLDQMKWIGLALAETGHDRGADFVEPLAIFKQAVAEGRARFPLSATHYFETGKTQNARRRIDLAATMTGLAGTLRIAPPDIIVPWEIRRALIELVGLPDAVPDLQLFGPGIAHAVGSPTLRYSALTQNTDPDLPDSMRRRVEQLMEAEFEENILALNSPGGTLDEMKLVLREIKRVTDDAFVSGQEYVATLIDKLGPGRLDEVMLAATFADIIVPLKNAAHELGVSLEDDIFAPGKMLSLIERMPSRVVEMSLRRQRQANPQKAWHGNDLNDVAALAVTVPYCDVVVTERSWSAMLNDAKVPQRFGTMVTPRLDRLIERLSDSR